MMQRGLCCHWRSTDRSVSKSECYLPVSFLVDGLCRSGVIQPCAGLPALVELARVRLNQDPALFGKDCPHDGFGGFVNCHTAHYRGEMRPIAGFADKRQIEVNGMKGEMGIHGTVAVAKLDNGPDALDCH